MSTFGVTTVLDGLRPKRGDGGSWGGEGGGHPDEGGGHSDLHPGIEHNNSWTYFPLPDYPQLGLHPAGPPLCPKLIPSLFAGQDGLTTERRKWGSGRDRSDRITSVYTGGSGERPTTYGHLTTVTHTPRTRCSQRQQNQQSDPHLHGTSPGHLNLPSDPGLS